MDANAIEREVSLVLTSPSPEVQAAYCRGMLVVALRAGMIDGQKYRELHKSTVEQLEQHWEQVLGSNA